MFNEELIAAKVAARNAGKILMKYYKSEDNEVKMKGIDNPVTIADNEADKYLSEFLIGEFPDDGWLSEETVDTEERLSKIEFGLLIPWMVPKNLLRVFHISLLVLPWFMMDTLSWVFFLILQPMKCFHVKKIKEFI